MIVLLRIDGQMGMHTKEIEMDEEEVLHATHTVINGKNFIKSSLVFDRYTRSWKAEFYCFLSKDEDYVFNLVEWNKEEGGFTKAAKELKEQLRNWGA